MVENLTHGTLRSLKLTTRHEVFDARVSKLALELGNEAIAGLEKRLAVLYPEAPERDARRPEYLARLEFEAKTIIQMGYPGYFLIVADFINWAKQNAVPVGPGRGSGAGSLIAYALGITDLDPLRYTLLFERFRKHASFG